MSDRDEILTVARKLAETISESGVYKNYRSSFENIKQQPSLFLRLQAFKETQSETEDKLPSDDAELINNPDTSVFLKNEIEILKIYSDVLDIIDNACEIELF